MPFGLPLAGFFSRYVTSSWRVSTPNLPRFRSKEGRHIWKMGYDRIVYIRYHFSCGLDRKDACWLSFTPLTGWFFLHFLLCFTMSQSSFWVIALAVLVSDSCLSDVEAEACPVRCRKMGVRRQEGNSCRHHESLVQSHGAHRTSVLSVTFVLLVLHDGMIWGYVLDSKKRARRAQGVHDAMLKSLLGEAQTYGGDRF